jgi:methylglyoxal reductase
MRVASRNPAGLSPIGYGSWEAGGGGTWGPNSSLAEVTRAIRAAVDTGVGWIDTAEVYGGGGGSERVVGEAIRDRPEVKVCTKVAPENEDHFTEAGMRAALTASLKRLGRDRLDVYLLHWPSASTPVREPWEALCKLKAEGLVGAIGLSNFPVADVVECAETGELDYLQIQASMLYRDELRRYGPLCLEHGVGVMVYGALAYGLLTGTVGRETTFTDWRGGEVGADDFFCVENYDRFFSAAARDHHISTVDGLVALAAEFCCTPARLALVWLLSDPVVTTVLAGTRNIAHAVDNVAAAELTLTAEQLARIESVLAAQAR